ncbi:MAG: rRNA maturation RNase YbeY [Abditibacteriales bacterium]|nr:rRNA maturation RNase YbeY [Abditibacteriales bacterium]
MQAERIETTRPQTAASRDPRTSDFNSCGQRSEVKGHVELSLWLTTDRIIQRLNRRYRRVDEPTDVLSFPQIEWENGEAGKWGNWAVDNTVHLGDVVISLPMARRQALQHAWSFEEELAWLVVHGVLHLLGYQDATEKEREKMLKRQEEILTMMREV